MSKAFIGGLIIGGLAVIAAELFFILLAEISVARRQDPPTKEEWKVM